MNMDLDHIKMELLERAPLPPKSTYAQRIIEQKLIVEAMENRELWEQELAAEHKRSLYKLLLEEEELI